MPFYKDAMSYGNLYINFEVDFPKKGELKNADQLKNVFYINYYQFLMLIINRFFQYQRI